MNEADTPRLQETFFSGVSLGKYDGFFRLFLIRGVPDRLKLHPDFQKI